MKKQLNNNQRGLSLIELLVSLVIGLFLVGGLATNLMSAKSSDKSRQAISELDSNAQHAMDAIRQAVSQAGYPSTRNIYLDKAFYTESDGTADNPTCRNTSLKRDIDGFTPGEDEWTRDGNTSDTITIVSLADNPCIDGESSCAASANTDPTALVYIDCANGGRDRDERTVACSTDLNSGMKTPSDAKLFNTFRLDSSEKALICDGNRGGSSGVSGGAKALRSKSVCFTTYLSFLFFCFQLIFPLSLYFSVQGGREG